MSAWDHKHPKVPSRLTVLERKGRGTPGGTELWLLQGRGKGFAQHRRGKNPRDGRWGAKASGDCTPGTAPSRPHMSGERESTPLSFWLALRKPHCQVLTMCACVCTCVHCMFVGMCMHMFACMCACAHVCLYRCVHVYAYACSYVCICVCMQKCYVYEYMCEWNVYAFECVHQFPHVCKTVHVSMCVQVCECV